MIEDNLAVPFETTVLGVTVTVRKISQTGSGIVAICVHGKHRQAIPILDLPLPDPPPQGVEWIAACRYVRAWPSAFLRPRRAGGRLRVHDRTAIRAPQVYERCMPT